MKPTISKPFKSNDRTFEKVFGLFNKKDYFNSKGLAKVQIGNFERALKKNDKGAQQVLDLFKGDEKKAKDYITQVVSDRNKERAFNNYKAMKDAVDSIQKGKPNVGAVDYVKRIIHNNNQKFSITLYSAISGKKFNNYKDIHKDIDSLIGESVNEGKKRYNQKDGVGKSKYVISYHDGKKKHKDGSDFFDIQIFRNKKDLAKFVNTLHKSGYVYGFNESLNESKTKESKIVQMMYKYAPKEKQFYTKLAQHEKRIGPRDYIKFIYSALKGLGLDPRKYRQAHQIPDAEEKIYQTISKK